MGNNPLIIGITGGKGGSGKSTVAVNLAIAFKMLGKRVLLIDSDVESPVEHILLSAERKKISEILSFRPKILEDKCVKCNLCVENCSEHALVGLPGRIPTLFNELCSGCKACYFVCPVKAIDEEVVRIGNIYQIQVDYMTVLQGELNPGFRQYVTVTVDTITAALSEKDQFDVVLIDTAPGTGANIFAAIYAADIVLAVTEPTPLGANDLSMLLELTNKMNKRTYIILNKATMPGGKKDLIYEVAKKRDIKVLAEIPYSDEIMSNYFKGSFGLDAENKYMRLFFEIAKKIDNIK